MLPRVIPKVIQTGECEQVTDRDFLLRYSDIEKLTDERDYFGVHKRRLGPIRIVPTSAKGGQK